MGRIDRYLFRTALIAFLAVLFSLTTMVWLTQVLRRFDLLASQGQTLLIVFKVTLLALPMLMLVIAPIALFIAVVYTLNKLNADSELVVMSASGVSGWRIFRPLFMLTALVALLSVLVSAHFGPLSLRTLREQIAKVNADIVANVAVPGRFNALEGLTFHIRERGANNTLIGIFVHDLRDPANEAVYIAERGRIAPAENGNGLFLILDQGILHRIQGEKRAPNFVKFQRHAFDMSQFTAAQTVQYRATDRPLDELIWPDPEDPVYKQDPYRFTSELHKRLSSPLYPLAAFIIAFAFLGEARTTRQSRGVSIAGAGIAFGVVEIIGFGTSGFVGRSALLTLVPYVIPLTGIVFGLLWIAGFIRLEVPAWVQRIADAINRRIERLQTA